MTNKVSLSAPFAKVIETTDGGREIWGFSTLEVKDKSGEIADFDGTVKAFDAWSSETSERTGGKNKGNVRVMHQPVAAGKTIHWEPKTTVVKDKETGEQKTVKGIFVGAYVPPTKSDVIRDIDEGILSSFSIGGSYEKRWWDEQEQAFRFIPVISEYSLVDNPCVPGADITQVIEKADAPWKHSKGGEPTSVEKVEQQVVKESENTVKPEDIAKAAQDAGLSLEQIKVFFNVIKTNLPDEVSPAPTNVTNVDGDGDDDDNKEFPNADDKASSTSAAESSVKASEKESGVAEKAAGGETLDTDNEGEEDDVNKDDMAEAAKGDKTDCCPNCGGNHKLEECDKAEKSASTADLQKSGKAISQKNAAHMVHATEHIQAALNGKDYTAEDHLTKEAQLVIEGESQGTNSGLESPEVAEKLFQQAFTKSMGAVVEGELAKSLTSFTKSVNDLKDMVKGLASKDSLEKAVSEIDSIKQLVKEIHETPQTGGPILNGGSPDLAQFVKKGFQQQDVAVMEEQVLQKFVAETQNPVLKDQLGQELARRQALKAFQ